MTFPTAGDSAGVPWQGRGFRPTGFEQDDGSAHPEVARLLEKGVPGLAELISVLPGKRLMVPVMAYLGEGQDATQAAAHGDKSADMATVTLTSPDGRKALPVFSGMAALAAWNTRARPVPVEARMAAIAAVEEGCELLVIDPMGPHRLVAPRPALWALAQGEPWRPVLQDRDAVAQITAAVRGCSPHIRFVELAPGRRAELAVVVTLVPGLTPADLDDVTAAVSRALSGLDVMAERVDSVELRFSG